MDLQSVGIVASTAILITTLVVLIWQVKIQLETLRKEAYQRCQSDYSSIIRLFIEKQELQKIYDELDSESRDSRWSKYSSVDKTLYNYLELNYELFERVYILRRDKWIDPKTWDQWNEWLKWLARHPLFTDVHNDNRGLFDRDFQELVDRILGKT
jgi:hypothetical protein